ncbi:MAG: hypothetical protein TQ37_07270 [Candidatus Synechococcus spongiarum 15L]|uniref:Uncharacterized protein n=2 Tax=Candidatus Synechococcus spongiarum TaxID=431041 RepID=A0A1T1D1D2_9SYNE|nr:hypothetical protein [Candidatus Synechococcus spongiarum]KKZ11351.1 MAG: hypothetical protein TQ37_07270 [Candidatus Synechococcus spongiarum 15L]OOV34675.1 hypothetical protein BV53_05275 [Candidatus Synechococcus spongiarum LMB bulk15N]
MKRLTAPSQQPVIGMTGVAGAALIGVCPGLLFAGAAAAGPFGFDLKSSVEPSQVYSFCSKIDSSWLNFECTIAPKPHPEMQYYYMRFVKDVGVCVVRGVGIDIPDDGSGSSLRFYTDLIADQLKHKYGQWGYKYDELNDDSIFYQPSSSWMSQLERGERSYLYVWSSSDLPVEHQNSIDHIILEATAENGKTGWFYIDFTTPLDDACQKAMSDVL